MSLKQIADGKVINVVLGADIASGVALKIGVLIGVSVTSGLNGGTVAFQLDGVHTLPKATGQAWTQGATLYWDDGAKNFTTTVGTNTKAGTAWAAAGSGDATGSVRLNGVGS